MEQHAGRVVKGSPCSYCIAVHAVWVVVLPVMCPTCTQPPPCVIFTSYSWYCQPIPPTKHIHTFTDSWEYTLLQPSFFYSYVWQVFVKSQCGRDSPSVPSSSCMNFYVRGISQRSPSPSAHLAEHLTSSGLLSRVCPTYTHTTAYTEISRQGTSS